MDAGELNQESLHMTTALMTRDDARRVVTYTPDAVALRDDALAASALIGRVGDAVEQAAAVDAQRAIKTALKLLEDTRKACKEPVIEFGRVIDETAKKFRAGLESEEIRIATLVGNFQTAVLAKARAAEAARQAELNALEKKRQEELAKANTHEERDAINTRADEEAKAAKPAVVQVQAKGQIVREQWAIKRIDSFVLAKARPDLVRKIEFDMTAIKALLNAGEKLPGVEAEREVTSTVRAERAMVLNV